MKRIAFAFSLVAATTLAAPLAAQSRNDGPWWDPGNTSGRTRDGTIYDGRNDRRSGTVYDRGSIYDSRRADGQWHRAGRDNRGNIIYVRTRYERDGDLIQERARRDTRGRFRVFDRRVIRSANDRRNDRIYRDRDHDNDRNNDGWEDRYRGRSSKNDRWAQNNGHDNGKHNGWYKNGKAKGRR